jgi:hypothetical protein
MKVVAITVTFTVAASHADDAKESLGEAFAENEIEMVVGPFQQRAATKSETEEYLSEYRDLDYLE